MLVLRGGRRRGELWTRSPARCKANVSMANSQILAQTDRPGQSGRGGAAAAGTSRNTVVRLHNDMAAILAMPAVKDRLNTLGFDVAGEGPDQLAALLKSDTEKWGAVVQKAGIARLD